MIHDAGRQPFEVSCSFPEISQYARDLDADGQQTLKALLMPQNLATALQTLQTFWNVPYYLFVSDSQSRQAVPETAAFARVISHKFFLFCNFHPGAYGRSRGVVVEGVTDYAR